MILWNHLIVALMIWKYLKSWMNIHPKFVINHIFVGQFLMSTVSNNSKPNLIYAIMSGPDFHIMPRMETFAHEQLRFLFSVFYMFFICLFAWVVSGHCSCLHELWAVIMVVCMIVIQIASTSIIGCCLIGRIFIFF